MIVWSSLTALLGIFNFLKYVMHSILCIARYLGWCVNGAFAEITTIFSHAIVY